MSKCRIAIVESELHLDIILHSCDTWSASRLIVLFGPRISKRLSEARLLRRFFLCIPLTAVSRYAFILIARLTGREVLAPYSSSSRLHLILKLFGVQHLLIADGLISSTDSLDNRILSYPEHVRECLGNGLWEESVLLSKWHTKYMKSMDRVEELTRICSVLQIRKIVFEGKHEDSEYEERLDSNTLIVLHPDSRKRGHLEGKGSKNGCEFWDGGLMPSEWVVLIGRVERRMNVRVHAYKGLIRDLIEMRKQGIDALKIC